jgi:ubiquitin-like-conjugating enzyme ATG3
LDDGWIQTDNPINTGAKQTSGAMDIDDMENIEDDNQDMQEEAVDIDDIDNIDSKEDNIFSSDKYIIRQEQEDTVHKNRTYDLSVTYDFYYQTPRLWLIGYSETGQILSEKEIFEDIMADYAKKTVTMEPHPHLGIKQASIHPCNHAKVMKKIIDTIQMNGGTPQVHQSIFVFLKFISSVVPTIEYDFTIDLELD